MSTQKRIFLSPPHMGGHELEYIQKVFESNYIAPLGEFVDRFEESLKLFTGAKNVLALSSGTAAIHLALRVLGIGEGDLVAASSFTFIGSVAPILYQNAKPLFIDSEEKSWNLDPNLLEDELVSRKKAGKKMPKALILTHIYGQFADIKAIKEICDRYEIYLIEDAAEALGATCENRHAGTFGIFGIYSFNGNKIITTSGGGILVSSDRKLLEQARMLSTQAREPMPWYEHDTYGYNYRMSNVLASIGVGQMEVLESRIKRKREIFESYQRALKEIDEISFMPELPNTRGNRWLTTVTFGKTDPETIRQALEKENIESRPLWKPMHLQPVFKKAKKRVNGVSQHLFEKGLCLPSGTAMNDEDITKISALIKKAIM